MNCAECNNDISNQFTYKNSRGKEICIHCFAEDFKKQARNNEINKINVPRHAGAEDQVI
jgi:hypothetical protein